MGIPDLILLGTTTLALVAVIAHFCRTAHADSATAKRSRSAAVATPGKSGSLWLTLARSIGVSLDSPDDADAGEVLRAVALRTKARWHPLNQRGAASADARCPC